MSEVVRIRVAVLSGGRSSEHEISLASGASVSAALDPDRYDRPDRSEKGRRDPSGDGTPTS